MNLNKLTNLSLFSQTDIMLAYAESAAAIEALIFYYGENVLSDIIINLHNNGFDDALELASGKSLESYQINFELFKKKQTLTFSKTYKTLINEIENLFLININDIINQKFNSSEQTGKGSYHNKKDLPKLLKNWEQNIYQTILKYKELYK